VRVSGRTPTSPSQIVSHLRSIAWVALADLFALIGIVRRAVAFLKQAYADEGDPDEGDDVCRSLARPVPNRREDETGQEDRGHRDQARQPGVAPRRPG
jgi:hypothetical protein